MIFYAFVDVLIIQPVASSVKWIKRYLYLFIQQWFHFMPAISLVDFRQKKTTKTHVFATFISQHPNAEGPRLF